MVKNRQSANTLALAMSPEVPMVTPRGGPGRRQLLLGAAAVIGMTTQDQADYLKAAACMRSHGIVGFPDAVFSGGQVDFPIPQAMNTKSTQFGRAREICEMLIPAGLPYSQEAEGGQ